MADHNPQEFPIVVPSGPTASSSQPRNALQILDLTEAEEAVVNSLLEHGSQSVSKLSRTADIPRTTVNSVLTRLRERQLVQRVSKGYLSVWNLVPAERIQDGLRSSLGYLDRDTTAAELEHAIGVQTAENKEFFVFSGITEMFHVYQWLMLNHFNQSVCRVQPYIATAALFGRLQPREVSTLCDTIKDNNIALTLILSDKARDIYATVSDEPSRYSKQLAEHAAAAYIVPESVLPFDTELVLGRSTALILNWKAHNMVLVKHPGTVALLRSFVQTLVEIAGHKNASGVHYAS